MSETSPEYRAGMEKLGLWDDQPCGECTEIGDRKQHALMWIKGVYHDKFCPDIRKDKAAAWDALVAYGEVLRRNALSGTSAQLRFTLGLDGGTIVDAFYAAIEVLGRTT